MTCGPTLCIIHGLKLVQLVQISTTYVSVNLGAGVEVIEGMSWQLGSSLNLTRFYPQENIVVLSNWEPREAWFLHFDSLGKTACSEGA